MFSTNFTKMKLPTLKRKQTGFTLIELLIVVAIIAILISIGLASYSRVQKSARDSQRKTDLRNVAGALEQFYSDWDAYPPSFVMGGTGQIAVRNATSTRPSCADISSGGTILSWGTSGFNCPGTSKTYLSQLPKDPLPLASNPQYCYRQISSGQGYELYTKLETGVASTLPCGPNSYNYKISSAD
jgi:prepilin-type N-terminal cleavage/methylation domain-containing protein